MNNLWYAIALLQYKRMTPETTDGITVSREGFDSGLNIAVMAGSKGTHDPERLYGIWSFDPPQDITESGHDQAQASMAGREPDFVARRGGPGVWMVRPLGYV